VECSPSKCPAKALISFQEHAAPRVLLNIKHQQHCFLMIAYIPNGYHRKNNKKKWACPLCEANSFASHMPSRYVRNFSPAHYIHTVVHEHQCFVFLAKFRTLARETKKNSGESNKGLFGKFLKRKSPYIEKKNYRSPDLDSVFQ